MTYFCLGIVVFYIIGFVWLMIEALRAPTMEE
jgi:hypothetical protein